MKKIIILIMLILLANEVFANNSDKILKKVGESYGSSPGSAKWNSNADINKDGAVNVYDLALASKSNAKPSYKTYSESDPTIIFVEPNETMVRTLGKNFSVNISIKDASETWAWEFKLKWNPSVLSITNIKEGLFLGRDTYSTAIFNNTNYTEGWTMIGSTLLEPALASSGNGNLVTIDFTVVGEISSKLDLYDTVLLDSNMHNYTHTSEDGSFTLLCLGDINGDGSVDILDASMLSAHWYPGPPIGPLGYDQVADLNSDGSVDILDASMLSAHWYPGPPIGPLGHSC